MTGVVKSVGKYALLAGTALALSISVASAASLTKAGMDKRVADLEREVTLLKNQMKSAMMAKPADKSVSSSTTRVKVTLWGQVNSAARFASTGQSSGLQPVNNGESGARFGMRATTQFNKDLGGVAAIELGTDPAGRGQDIGSEAHGGTVSVRRGFIDLVHKDIGTLSIGHSGLASGSGPGSTFNGTSIVFGVLGPGSNDGVTATATVLGEKMTGIARHSTGVTHYKRMNRILYSTPNLMGASLSASYHADRGWAAGLGYSGPPGVKEIGVSLGFGFRAVPKTADAAAQSNFAVSGGIKHNASGLSVNGYWGYNRVKSTLIAAATRSNYWMADVSWSGSITEAGATAVSLGYGVWGGTDGTSTTRYHVAINQNVDAAAADVYAGVSYDTGDFMHTEAAGTGNTSATDVCGDETAAAETCSVDRDGVLILIGGVRIKF